MLILEAKVWLNSSNSNSNSIRKNSSKNQSLKEIIIPNSYIILSHTITNKRRLLSKDCIHKVLHMQVHLERISRLHMCNNNINSLKLNHQGTNRKHDSRFRFLNCLVYLFFEEVAIHTRIFCKMQDKGLLDWNNHCNCKETEDHSHKIFILKESKDNNDLKKNGYN